MSRRRSMEAILSSEYVSIGELVRLSEVRYSTLKFYTEEGMLPFHQEDEGLVRRFPRVASMERLNRIQKWKEDGYSIRQIQEKLLAEK